MEHYYQEPADYDWGTYQTKEISLAGLADCKFSYSDGSTWYESWDEKSEQLPKIVKIKFRFNDKSQEKEFIVNIPISQ